MNSIRAGLTILLIFFSRALIAQDLDPWVYNNLPLKMNSAAVSYALVDGNVIGDPASPIQNFNTTTHKIVAGYLRTIDFFGKLGRIQLIVPFSFMSGTAKINGLDTAGTRTGFDDMRLRIGLNIFGSPPLEPKNFGTYRQEAIIGASIVIVIPLGQYYPERVVNLGSNRWGFKPEVGLSIRVGQFFCELYGGVKFTTANYVYLGSKALKQSPLYSIQTHLSHTFSNNMRIALSGTYVNGGQTSINDNKLNDYIRHFRGGVSFGVSIKQTNLITLQLNSTISTNASLDYRSLVLSYSYTWF